MSTIRALSWNVNGLRAAYKKGFLEWLEKESPDILCLQETKAAEDQLPMDLRMAPGYDSHFAVAEKKGYSGVALYTKLKPRKVSKGFGIERFDSEGRTLIADYGDFVLFGIYFPNGKASNERLRYKMDFYDSFLEYADSLKNAGRHIIFCGDVNTAHKEIDIARPKETRLFQAFFWKSVPGWTSW